MPSTPEPQVAPPVADAAPPPVPASAPVESAPGRDPWAERFAALAAAEAKREAREARYEARIVEQHLLVERMGVRIDNLQARLRLLEEDNKRMQRDNATLRDALGAKFPGLDVSYVAARDSPTDAVGPAARVLDDLLDAALLAQEDFGGPHIVFLDAAFESAGDSPLQRSAVPRGYEYVRAVCEVARRVHANTLGTGVYQAFADLGIEYKSDISKTAATRHGKHYTFRWKQEDGTTREILAGPHIGFGRGGANDSIRIYWHWDKEGRRFVLCHVGRHLPDEST